MKDQVQPIIQEKILTAASRLPFPEVPGPIQVLPAWQWMMEEDKY